MNQDVAILNDLTVNQALETLDPKERRYVLQVTVGRLSKAEAANDAGFARPPQGLAVQNAMRVIQNAMAAELCIDFQHIATGLQDAIEMARGNNDPGTMINGYREQGRLAGLYIDKKEIDINVRHLDEGELPLLSEAELEELIQQADSIELSEDDYSITSTASPVRESEV